MTTTSIDELNAALEEAASALMSLVGLNARASVLMPDDGTGLPTRLVYGKHGGIWGLWLEAEGATTVKALRSGSMRQRVHAAHLLKDLHAALLKASGTQEKDIVAAACEARAFVDALAESRR